MAETGRHTNTVSGKRRPQNVYVDGNTVRKVQEAVSYTHLTLPTT